MLRFVTTRTASCNTVKEACGTMGNGDLPLTINRKLTKEGNEKILDTWYGNPSWLPLRIVAEIGDASLTARHVTTILLRERKNGRVPLSPDEREEGLPDTANTETAKTWLTAGGRLTPAGEISNSGC
jgi:hypothetical protein